MNRTVFIGAVIVLLAGGGYYQFVYKPQREVEMMAELRSEAAKVAAEVRSQDNVDTAAPVESPAAEPETTAPAAAPATAETTAPAAPEVTAPAAGTAPAETATPATPDAATPAAPDAAAAAVPAALDPATFNADAVVALIDGSTLDDARKATLKTAVEAARTNPALVPDTVAQVRTALGL